MAITKIQHGMIDVDAVDIENLSATGTASSSTYLRGDNTWSEIRVFDQDLFTTSTVTFAGLTITNTASMAKLVVNGTGTISRDLFVGDDLTVYGGGAFNGSLVADSLNISNNGAINGSLRVYNSATISGNLYGSNNLDIAGSTRLRGTVQVDDKLTANTFTSTFAASVGTDLKVGGSLRTADFFIGNEHFPQGPGNFGQILWTTGATGGTKGSTYYQPNQALWGNYSDVIFWSLFTDLTTNGYNIASGASAGVPDPQLTIGTGETGSFSSYIQLKEDGLGIEVMADGNVDVLADTLHVAGDFNAVNARVFANLTVDQTVAATTLQATTVTTTEISGVQGIAFADGSVQLTAYTGGGSTGTTSSYVLPIATTTRLGGIKVGSYLSINSATGVLSVVGSPYSYTLPKATGSTLGGVKVGSGLAIDANGVLSTTGGGGGGGTGTTMTGVVSLTADMYTNGYHIQRDAGTSNNYLLLHTDADLRGDNINLLSDSAVIVGNTIYDSRLYVSEIKNYSGVGPPLVPEGIQFSDSTIQTTAWFGYDQGVFTH